MGKEEEEPTFEELLEKLEDENEGIREGAVRALGLLGDKRAGKPLLDILREKLVERYEIERYEYIIKITIEALEKLGFEEDVYDLNSCLVLAYLMRQGKKEALIQFVREGCYVEDDNYIDGFSSSRYWLEELNFEPLSDQEQEKIIRLLRGEYEVKRMAIQTLGYLGNKKALEPIMNSLKETSEHEGLGEEFTADVITAFIHLDAINELIQYAVTDDFFLGISGVGDIPNYLLSILVMEDWVYIPEEKQVEIVEILIQLLRTDKKLNLRAVRGIELFLRYFRNQISQKNDIIWSDLNSILHVLEKKRFKRYSSKGVNALFNLYKYNLEPLIEIFCKANYDQSNIIIEVFKRINEYDEIIELLLTKLESSELRNDYTYFDDDSSEMTRNDIMSIVHYLTTTIIQKRSLNRHLEFIQRIKSIIHELKQLFKDQSTRDFLDPLLREVEEREFEKLIIQRNKIVLSKLYELLQSDKKRDRLYALWGLGELQLPETVDKIQPLVEDNDRYVSKRAIEILDKILNRNIESRKSIERILEEPTFEELLDKLRDKTSLKSRKEAVTALGQLNDNRVIEVLKEALNDSILDVRILAAQRLIQLDVNVKQVLLENTKSKNKITVLRAQETLERMHKEEEKRKWKY